MMPANKQHNQARRRAGLVQALIGLISATASFKEQRPQIELL
jgi:hypothetical protein